MIQFPEDISMTECVDLEKHLFPEQELIPPDDDDDPPAGVPALVGSDR